MGIATLRDLLVGTLQLGAISASAWGLHQVYGLSGFSLAFFFNSAWFLISIASNTAGFFSILMYLMEPGEQYNAAFFFLHSHYILSWLTVIIGYPALITNTWVVYSGGSYYAWANCAAPLIPLSCWFFRKEMYIGITTQVTVTALLLSHFYIYYLVNNFYGEIGVGLMVLNLISISVPTRRKILGISSRETFLVGLGVTSFVFALAVEEMIKKPGPVTNWTPVIPSW